MSLLQHVLVKCCKELLRRHFYHLGMQPTGSATAGLAFKSPHTVFGSFGQLACIMYLQGQNGKAEKLYALQGSMDTKHSSQAQAVRQLG